MDKSVHIKGGKEFYGKAVTAQEMVEKAAKVLKTTMVQDRRTGEWYDPDVRFQELMQEPWFQAQMVRMRMRDQGYKDVTVEEPEEMEQVLVTDGKEFRVLHREEGAWAFEVAPCDRDAMKFWKKLVD